MKKNALVTIFLFVVIFWSFWGQQTVVKKSDFRDAPKDDFGYIDLSEIRNNSNVPAPKKAIVDNTVQQPTIQNVAIYGDNTIRDYYLVKKSLQELSHSVAAFVKKSSLIFDEKKQKYVAITSLVGKSRYLADDEEFSDQLKLAFCSGSLVGDDLVMTAGHCIDNTSYRDVYVVFGWRQTGKGQYNLEFSKDEVYEVERLIIHKLSGDINSNDTYEDYALVLLKQPVRNLKELSIDRNGYFVFEKNKVFTIGYPMGMSVKITDPNDAMIYKVGKTQFSTDIDCFGGNSGGPVFDSYSKRIIGIVVTSDAKEVKYTLNRDIQISYKVDETRKDVAIEATIERDGSEKREIVAPNMFYNYLKAISARKKIIVNESANTITFMKGGEYYNFDLFPLLVNIGGGIEIFDKGKLHRNASYKDGTGTGAQRINSLIETFIPLNSEERAFCNAISNQMQKMRPVIDPKLMMLYKMNKCDKSIEI